MQPRAGGYPPERVRFGFPGCPLQSLVSLSPQTSFLQATQPLREAALLPRVVSLLGELRMSGESGPSSSVRASRGAHPEPRPSLSRGPSVPLPISGVAVDLGVPPRLVSVARSVLGELVPGAAAAEPVPAGGGAALPWAWVCGGGAVSGAAVGGPVPERGGAALRWSLACGDGSRPRGAGGHVGPSSARVARAGSPYGSPAGAACEGGPLPCWVLLRAGSCSAAAGPCLLADPGWEALASVRRWAV
jgi:hypothetical protein